MFRLITLVVFMFWVIENDKSALTETALQPTVVMAAIQKCGFELIQHLP